MNSYYDAPDDKDNEQAFFDKSDRDYDDFVDSVLSGERPPRNASEDYWLRQWKGRHAKQPHPAR